MNEVEVLVAAIAASSPASQARWREAIVNEGVRRYGGNIPDTVPAAWSGINEQESE